MLQLTLLTRRSAKSLAACLLVVGDRGHWNERSRWRKRLERCLSWLARVRPTGLLRRKNGSSKAVKKQGGLATRASSSKAWELRVQKLDKVAALRLPALLAVTRFCA